MRRYSIQEARSEVADVWQAGYFNDVERQFQRSFDKHVDALVSAFRRGEQPPVPARAGR